MHKYWKTSELLIFDHIRDFSVLKKMTSNVTLSRWAQSPEGMEREDTVNSSMQSICIFMELHYYLNIKSLLIVDY